MSRFAGMQYCKTDLVASKGIAFVKYATSSAACMAMETVQMAGMVAGYKVKIMLAEPKTRRTDPTQAFLQGLPGGAHGGIPGLLPGAFGGAGAGGPLMPSLSHGLLGPAMGLQDFSSLGSLGGGGGFGHGGGMSSLGPPLGGGMNQGGMRAGGHGGGGSHLDMGSLEGSQQVLGNGGFGSLGNLNAPPSDYSKLGSGFGGGGSGLGLTSPMLSAAGLLGPPAPYQPQLQQHQQQHQQYNSADSSVGLPNSRLFIVVHKSAAEEALSALFRCYPGMEYLDLKRDRVTGRSKGYAYVNYTTPAAAGAAQAQLNGIEYPPGTGSRLKVLFAEPLGSMPRPRSGDVVSDSGVFHSGSGGGSGGPGSAVGGTTLLGTPSNDTGATSFHLSSPNSRDSVGGGGGGGHSGNNNLPGALGQAALASAAAQQAQQQLSARTDLSSASHDSIIISPRSSPLRLSGNTAGGGNDGLGGMVGGDLTAGLGGLTLRDALNGGIGNGSIGGLGAFSVGGVGGVGGGHNSPPSDETSGGNGSAGDHGSWRESSPDLYNINNNSTGTSAGPSPAKTTSPLHLPPLPSIDDATVVYSALSKPLPDYALTHVFKQCGNVEFVRVLPDERVALIKYSSAEAAAAAVGSLNGVEVLGEVLQVRSSPPLSFRDRHAEVGSAS
jgi:RNA recognition motif-containing protein